MRAAPKKVTTASESVVHRIQPEIGLGSSLLSSAVPVE